MVSMSLPKSIIVNEAIAAKVAVATARMDTKNPKKRSPIKFKQFLNQQIIFLLQRL